MLGCQRQKGCVTGRAGGAQTRRCPHVAAGRADGCRSDKGQGHGHGHPAEYSSIPTADSTAASTADSTHGGQHGGQHERQTTRSTGSSAGAQAPKGRFRTATPRPRSRARWRAAKAHAHAHRKATSCAPGHISLLPAQLHTRGIACQERDALPCICPCQAGGHPGLGRAGRAPPSAAVAMCGFAGRRPGAGGGARLLQTAAW